MLIKNIPIQIDGQYIIDSDPIEQKDGLKPFIDAYLESPRKKALYLHTPFCPVKCKYCKWQSSKLILKEDLEFHYIETFPKQLKLYKRIFDNVIFDEVYLGGGTPTIASSSGMKHLFDQIPNFKKIPNKCLEASPDTLTTYHIDLFKEYEFKFLSIGIQSMSFNVMKRNDRPYVSERELKNLCHYLNERGIYFNLDLICYLDTGDLRDIPDFERELKFIMGLDPASITIHQEANAFQSFEKTFELMHLVKRAIQSDSLLDPKWRCVNSDLLDMDVPYDTFYRAEYRIVSRDYNYMHHLWDKYNLNLKEDYDVLSLGSTKAHPLFSFTGEHMYYEELDTLRTGPHLKYGEWMYNYLNEIRVRKGLQPIS